MNNKDIISNNDISNNDISNNDISNNDISKHAVFSKNNILISKNDVSNNLIQLEKSQISLKIDQPKSINNFYEENDNAYASSEYMRLTNLLKVNQKKINNLEDFQEENDILKEKINELELKNECKCKDANSTIKELSDPFEILLNLYIILKEIKEKLKEMNINVGKYQYELELGTQDKDDLIFYKSIILDSKKYFTNAFKIREIKLIYDLNQIMKMFNDKRLPEVFELNKNIITLLKTHYNKVLSNIKNNNQKSINPTWIKNNKLKFIKDIESEMNRIFLYHIDINTHFKSALIKEIKFYKF